VNATILPGSTQIVSFVSFFRLLPAIACIKALPSPERSCKIRPSPPKNPVSNLLANSSFMLVPFAAHEKLGSESLFEEPDMGNLYERLSEGLSSSEICENIITSLKKAEGRK
jgi:hypothetical protein